MFTRFLLTFLIFILPLTVFAQNQKEDLRKPPLAMIRADVETIKSLVIKEMATDRASALIKESPSEFVYKRMPEGGKALLGQIMNKGNTPYNIMTITFAEFPGEVQVAIDTTVAVTDTSGVERITSNINSDKKYRAHVIQFLAELRSKAEAMPKKAPAVPVETLSSVKNSPAISTTKMVFASNRNGNSEIYLLGMPAGKQVNLTNHSSEDNNPRLSPDGQKIAFSSNRNGGKWQTFLMNSDGADQRLLTDGGYADWSPDGKSLVFGLQQKDHDELFSINANGTGLKKLTNMGKETTHPAWSPDGKKIAFASEKDGNRQLYVMNSDGSNPVRLMNNKGYDDYPAWSPDGKQIAFASDRDSHKSDKLELYVMNADGTSIRRLTNHPADDRHPDWSSDGKRIAFASDRNGSRDIFFMGADGTGSVEKLVSAFGDDEHPYWLKISFSPKNVMASNSVVANPALSNSEAPTTKLVATQVVIKDSNLDTKDKNTLATFKRRDIFLLDSREQEIGRVRILGYKAGGRGHIEYAQSVLVTIEDQTAPIVRYSMIFGPTSDGRGIVPVDLKCLENCPQNLSIPEKNTAAMVYSLARYKGDWIDYVKLPMSEEFASVAKLLNFYFRNTNMRHEVVFGPQTQAQQTAPVTTTSKPQVSPAEYRPVFKFVRDCNEQGVICNGSFRASTDFTVQNGGMKFIDFGIEYTSSSDWVEIRLYDAGGWPYSVDLTVLKTRQTKNWLVKKNNSGILVTGQGLSVQAKETIKKFDTYMRLEFDQYRSSQVQTQMKLLTSELVRYCSRLKQTRDHLSSRNARVP